MGGEHQTTSSHSAGLLPSIEPSRLSCTLLQARSREAVATTVEHLTLHYQASCRNDEENIGAVCRTLPASRDGCVVQVGAVRCGLQLKHAMLSFLQVEHLDIPDAVELHKLQHWAHFHFTDT